MVKRARILMFTSLLVVGALLNIVYFTELPGMVLDAPRNIKDYIFFGAILRELEPVEFRKSPLNMGQRPLYVTLTSIAGKQEKLFDVVNSLLHQSIVPDKIFLYLSREPYLQDTGFSSEGVSYPALVDLIRTHEIVEVKWVENTGPYRKLVPLLREKWNEDVLLAQVDDDIRYHPYLLENLVLGYNMFNCVAAGRAWVMRGVEKDEDIVNWKYDKWKYATKWMPQKYVMSTGMGGVLYHPKMFHKTPWVLDQTKFLQLAPFGDDIWFNLARIANDVPCVTIRDTVMSKNGIKGLSLWRNYNSHGNDKQIHDTMNFVLQSKKN
eukprot:gb/GECG01004324.1/.p1 GENE.gb/GECG01004324.1/~~gb/GECG01004324.1/.p1  ORF type:complete len:322 (+),score=27.63 gb/GECG01004324.1/:1-966(+)